jgi:hypothetical protein
MAIINQIQRTFKVSFEKEWYETYWAFDIHGTILQPSYDLNEEGMEFYPWAKEALQEISKRDDIIMILYTCSYPQEIHKYTAFFEKHGIKFKHVNENPGISSNMGNFGFYEDKFYFNVLFEDKAGFDPVKEWKEVYELMVMYRKEKILPDPNWTTKY